MPTVRCEPWIPTGVNLWLIYFEDGAFRRITFVGEPSPLPSIVEIDLL
jgi:hypothetical protein